ncbi:nucleotidyltransferase family protein [Hyunsoonleella sp. 2307UL5-6]|uniref:nucleotidyltransferase family protein n=1 Tax=Hyunsoonleella sp. 2307UL5-6 TaxID=3384768 RepID=UPI0039BC84A8
MSSTPNISIAILAAGASKRMGSPKQLLKWKDSTLLKHAIKTCKNTLVKDVIVVLGANCQVIASEIKDEMITVITNTSWELGLGKSIGFAAEYVSTSKENSDGLMIVLADQPYVTSSFLNIMIEAFNGTSKGIIATAYKADKKGVPALFHKKYLMELAQLSGDDGAKSILKKYSSSVSVIIPDFENIDIDTPQDYQQVSKPSA